MSRRSFRRRPAAARWCSAVGALILGVLGVPVRSSAVTLPKSLTQRPATAGNPASDEAAFIASINSVRASHGIPALVTNATLRSIATNWSTHMRSDSTLSHNPNFVDQLPNDWQTAGENVGTGPDESDIAAAFIKSPEHYVNIVRPAYTDIGVGVVYGADGTLWVTEDFASFSAAGTPPQTSVPPPTTQPPTQPTTQPPTQPTTQPPTQPTTQPPAPPTTLAPTGPTTSSVSPPSTPTATTSTVTSNPGAPADLGPIITGLRELNANS